MGLGVHLAQEVPFLRRYARAMLGSQGLGDAAVREVLQALLAAPQEFDQDAPTRIELYRVFHRLWVPADIAGDQHRPTQQLDPIERYVLLLTSVEGFKPDEVATILGIAEADVAKAAAQAQDTINQSLRSTFMIIEDEPVIAMHLRAVVEEYGHTVCGVARTHREAVALAERTQPELILADINLADGSSGIAAVQEILTEIDVPAVFVTSFPERLLSADRSEPTYVLTKPFEEAALLATVGQALLFHRERAAPADQPVA